MTESWEDGADPLAALRDGDTGPFEAFVRESLPRFLGFFRRLGARPTEAEDLTQDLFVKLYEHSDGYAAQGRFGAFAFRVARNLWIDRGRRAAVRPRAVSTGGGRDADGEGDDPLGRIADEGLEAPGEALSRREEGELLRAAVGRLSETHRMVFELGVVQDLAYRDIAAILDVPVGTVKSRMFHAVRKLRESLGHDGLGPDGLGPDGLGAEENPAAGEGPGDGAAEKGSSGEAWA